MAKKQKSEPTQERDIEKHEWTRSKLMRLSREDMAEVAIGLNLNPRRLKNKGVMADAILLEQNDGILEGHKLTMQQESFCELYSTQRDFFGNGVQAYIEAYDVDVSTPGGYASARASAAALLTNINILKRIDELLEVLVLNDTAVDKKLSFWIMQDANPMASLGAIKEYNKLKKRTVDAMAPLANLTQNNYNFHITDDRGKEISAKFTDFMLEATSQETPAETTAAARDIRDYQNAT